MEKEEATLTMEVEKGLSDRYFKSLPPGIRFRPTDGELMDYLKKKVLKERMPLHRIKTCNIYKYHPNDLCRPDDLAREKESYFFTSRDKKYPNGARPDRKAGDGFWKATGRDMPISCKGEVVGSKKTLVYYEGKHKDVSLHKTNWIMHEYTINPNIKITPVAQGQSDNNNNNDNNILDECVLAKIYEKTTGSKKGADNNCSPSQDDTQQILDSEQLPPEEQDNPILEPQEYPTAEQVAQPLPQNPNHQNPMAGATAGGGYNTNMIILQGSEQLPLPPPEAQNNPILEPQQYSRAIHMGSLTGPNNEVRAQNNPILEPQQYSRATYMGSLTGPNSEVRAQNNPILEPQQYPMATRMDNLTGSRGGVRVQNNLILEPQQYPMATRMGSLIGPNNEIRAQNPILEPQQYPTTNRMDSLTGPKGKVRTQNNPIPKPQQYPTTTHMNNLTGHNGEILKEDYSTALQAAAAAASYPNHQNPMAGAAAAAAYHRYMMIPVSEQPPLPPLEAEENPILEQVAELPPFPYQENPMDVAAAAAATFYSWDAGSYGYESLQTDENFYGINSGAFSFEENNNNGFWGSLNGGLEDVVNMYIGNNDNNPSANPHGQANNAGDNVNPSHNPHGPANVSDK